MEEDGGIAYPFVMTGRPVLRIYKSMLLMDIALVSIALFVLQLFVLDPIVEISIGLILIFITLAILYFALYHDEGPKVYDPILGLDYWKNAPEYERKTVEEEIRRQFPMQVAIHSSIMQRAGVILGFGFVIITSYVLTYVRQGNTTYTQLTALLMILVIYSLCCFFGLKLFTSKSAYATTGTSVRHIMKYDWGEERLGTEVLNTTAAAYFTMVEANYNANRTLSLMSTLVVAGLIPIIVSVLIGVLF